MDQQLKELILSSNRTPEAIADILREHATDATINGYNMDCEKYDEESVAANIIKLMELGETKELGKSGAKLHEDQSLQEYEDNSGYTHTLVDYGSGTGNLMSQTPTDNIHTQCSGACHDKLQDAIGLLQEVTAQMHAATASVHKKVGQLRTDMYTNIQSFEASLQRLQTAHQNTANSLTQRIDNKAVPRSSLSRRTDKQGHANIHSSDLTDLVTRIAALETTVEYHGGNIPDMITNDIARLNTRLNELSTSLGERHLEHIAAVSEVDKRLSELIGEITASIKQQEEQLVGHTTTVSELGGQLPGLIAANKERLEEVKAVTETICTEQSKIATDVCNRFNVQNQKLDDQKIQLDALKSLQGDMTALERQVRELETRTQNLTIETTLETRSGQLDTHTQHPIIEVTSAEPPLSTLAEEIGRSYSDEQPVSNLCNLYHKVCDEFSGMRYDIAVLQKQLEELETTVSKPQTDELIEEESDQIYPYDTTDINYDIYQGACEDFEESSLIENSVDIGVQGLLFIDNICDIKWI